MLSTPCGFLQNLCKDPLKVRGNISLGGDPLPKNQDNIERGIESSSVEYNLLEIQQNSWSQVTRDAWCLWSLALDSVLLLCLPASLYAIELKPVKQTD